MLKSSHFCQLYNFIIAGEKKQFCMFLSSAKTHSQWGNVTVSLYARVTLYTKGGSGARDLRPLKALLFIVSLAKVGHTMHSSLLCCHHGIDFLCTSYTPEFLFDFFSINGHLSLIPRSRR